MFDVLTTSQFAVIYSSWFVPVFSVHKMINIVFDRPDHTYSPGDVVNLQIIVQVDSEKTFRSIYVRFHGFAHVEWTVSSLDYLYGLYIIKQTAYTAHETYFKNYQTLAGSEEGKELSYLLCNFT